MKHRIAFILLLLTFSPGHSQDFREQYEQFKKKTIQEYSSFRDECNQKYAEFLRQAWDWYEGKAPMPLPKEKNPVPPRLYLPDEDRDEPIYITPTDISPIDTEPQPKPIEPIRETPSPQNDYFEFDFYGVSCRVRLPNEAQLNIKNCAPNTIADGWQQLCTDDMNNAIRDCLETRIRYSLCDWAYLSFLDELCHKFCHDANGATLLTAFLYCQSGYQMRLAIANNKLIMLFGSKHQIYEKGYYTINSMSFYPLGSLSGHVSICNAVYEGETPMSLLIDSEQKIGVALSEKRPVESKKFADMTAVSQVPTELICFYNSYPSSTIDGNMMNRWAMYANTPLAQTTKEKLYPALKTAIETCTQEEAANKLLNWVQTGFVYEYDDKVWGRDRTFFAEETLYYPFCDCEDRSILFSRLVRDLLGLDVALIYYPGHLATAVHFDSEVEGDTVMIGNARFVICDPTYIGAPVGEQMPDLDYDRIQTIILRR